MSFWYDVYKQTGLKQLVAAGYSAVGAINNINNIPQTIDDANKKAQNIIANAEETANQIIGRAAKIASMLICLAFLLGLLYRWLT